jgi:hypothetical protein
MGDCDRYKPYISDYLENSLDPTTEKEFRNALKNSAELQILTNRVRSLKAQLGNLPNYSCSDDFSLHLREKIHTTPQAIISRQNVLRLSFAASIVLVLIVAMIGLNHLSDSSESPGPAEGVSDFQIEHPNPVGNPASGSNPNIFKKDAELQVKTKMAQQVVDDSSKVGQSPIKRKDDPRFKHVDQKQNR